MNWYIDENVPGANIGCRAIVDEDGTVVCLPSPMGEANARLIHAAPDLLAALEDLLAMQGGGYVAESVVRQVTERARAAIAKAQPANHVDCP